MYISETEVFAVLPISSLGITTLKVGMLLSWQPFADMFQYSVQLLAIFKFQIVGGFAQPQAAVSLQTVQAAARCPLCPGLVMPCPGYVSIRCVKCTPHPPHTFKIFNGSVYNVDWCRCLQTQQDRDLFQAWHFTLEQGEAARYSNHSSSTIRGAALSLDAALIALNPHWASMEPRPGICGEGGLYEREMASRLNERRISDWPISPGPVALYIGCTGKG